MDFEQRVHQFMGSTSLRRLQQRGHLLHLLLYGTSIEAVVGRRGGSPVYIPAQGAKEGLHANLANPRMVARLSWVLGHLFPFFGATAALRSASHGGRSLAGTHGARRDGSSPTLTPLLLLPAWGRRPARCRGLVHGVHSRRHALSSTHHRSLIKSVLLASDAPRVDLPVHLLVDFLCGLHHDNGQLVADAHRSHHELRDHPSGLLHLCFPAFFVMSLRPFFFLVLLGVPSPPSAVAHAIDGVLEECQEGLHRRHGVCLQGLKHLRKGKHRIRQLRTLLEDRTDQLSVKLRACFRIEDFRPGSPLGHRDEKPRDALLQIVHAALEFLNFAPRFR
mmetsp:Transcript_103602/g.246638  ORF Transcript_103602/g.246638 Transcript_103602/m.246638 type:complete len:333 (-) Transcript_103602:3887-4885(-)